MAAETWIEANISVFALATSAVYDPGNGCVYVTNQNSQNVSVINTSQGRIVASFSVPGDPTGIAYDPNHHLILVNDKTASEVSLVSDSTNLVVRNIAAGQSPSLGLLYLPSNGLAYAANYVSNNLTVINMTTNRTVASIPVGIGPQWIEYDPDNKMLYVANNGGSNVTVVNPATNQPVASISVPYGPFAVLFDPLVHRILTSIGGGGSGTSISIINPSVGSAVGSIPVGRIPRGEIFDTVTGYVYVSEFGSGDVLALNGSSLVSAGNVTTAYVPYAGVAFDPATATLYVPTGTGGPSYLVAISTALAETAPTFSLSPEKVVTKVDLGVTVSATTTVWAVGSGMLSAAVAVTPTGAAACSPPILAGGGNVSTSRCTTVTLGTTTVWINVTDRTGHTTHAFSTLEVVPLPIAGRPTANRTAADLQQQVSFQANLSGGAPPYSYMWTGLPPACGSGGSPVGCAVSPVGTLSIRVVARDSGGGNVTSPPLSYRVYPDPSITSVQIVGSTGSSGGTTNATSGTGRDVSFRASVTGGFGNIVAIWAGLPSGCVGHSLNFSCAPSAVGTYSVSVSVTDANNFTTASKPVTLVVSNSSSSGIPTLELAGIVGLVVLVAAIGSILMLRRRRRVPPPPGETPPPAP